MSPENESIRSDFQLVQKSTMPVTHSLSVVTVTYGKRWHLLEKVLHECRSQRVKEVIVVDNAATLPMNYLTQEFGQFVKVLHIPHNSGSAVGFKIGIKYALDAGAEYILLLDDDNVPAPGSIGLLSQALAESLQQHPSGHVAVLGNRTHPDSPPEIASKMVHLRPGSFLGFHIFDLPAKIWRRLNRGQSNPAEDNLPHVVNVEVCTFGGLLFHRGLVDVVGYPREDFVLYVDDYEMTYRLTSQGGRIALVTDALIHDLEVQWNAGNTFANSFAGWLLGNGECRAYYTARNRVYFEAHLQKHIPWVRRVNKALYLTILFIFSCRVNRNCRLRLLCRAIADGEKGNMGMNPEFPL